MVDSSRSRSSARTRRVPGRTCPDRYADAVRARRAELRAERRLLTGNHRTELRSCLALSRLAAAAAIGPALSALSAEAAAHVDAGRTARAGLPGSLDAALGRLTDDLHARWVHDLGPALRRTAAGRELAMPPGWPRLPAPTRPGAVTGPAPGRRGGLRSGVLDGVLVWRLALLPPALLTLLGGGVATGAGIGAHPLLPLAAGVALLAVGLVVGGRRAAADRARWHRHVEVALAAARTALDTDLGRRVLEVERSALADLDAAVERRRAEVDAELIGLTADRAAVPSGG